jgi:hypothetical protein
VNPRDPCTIPTFAWAHQQAEHLRKRRLAKLDYDHLAEEIEALAKRDRRALERHLRNLILHGLKWNISPRNALDADGAGRPAWTTPATRLHNCSAIILACHMTSRMRWRGRIPCLPHHTEADRAILRDISGTQPVAM